MTRESWLNHPSVAALDSGVRTRLGISPNHPSFRVGVLRTHLLTAVLAQAAAVHLKTSSSVRIRCDDTDQTRARQEHLPSLMAELGDVAAIRSEPEIWYQSARSDRYQRAIKQLGGVGALTWVGDVPCLNLVQVERLLPDATRRASANAVNLVPPQGRHPQHLVPLTRADGTALWHLASVVDDIDTRINFVVRGTDKVSALGIQHRIRRLLGDAEPVAYLFLPMLREASGRPVRIADLRARFLRPSALRWFLA